ncbi:polysaccharide lyase [Aetokthonos hydrillicola Thurmond2011]|jgi:hypothetical protein|uniref:Polysaccharide lyase n=2 Tax=Aetokthonos TaxID=1550243 RepID=A0AAP5I403_9CYAN|nr:heparin lyase I family protein [Aetokthonos hydrillicola]MBO3459242.1 hypothetical protein [Aetokthonos hydrillicola CCALA 1050]MBW4584925.1 polysaccharide lyase [Aetokthonos hydrillicola CCALA 1050]MDR9894316.1 polysaccharide lyase [Aetokthonos hydrillicola Thurmond2011]
MKKYVLQLISCTFVLLIPLMEKAQAELFVRITGEPTNGASIDSQGNLKEAGRNYRVIYKPDPRANWVYLPWISSSEFYKGSSSIGMEIDPTENLTPNGTDKVNHRISSAGSGSNDSFALDFNQPKYTGFAVKLGEFDVPSKSLLLGQWWQGSPYSPPLQLEIIPDSNPSNPIRYQFLFRNNRTGGNPKSLIPNVIPFNPGVDNTLNRQQWHTFIVYTKMRHTGLPDDGEVRVWHNGVEVIRWLGKIGYDPSIALNGKNLPNKTFDVFYGLYREQQSKKHQAFFDEIRFATTWEEANPEQP